ncbi:uncharacterized protein LOC109792401 [Cajanus cajan]|nr:uncharacterized protein LOC109792401 [Cajanus cajan]
MEVRCKLFMGTLKKAALDWFSGLPNRSITDFDVFSRLFMAQFAANNKKPPITSDLFDLKQQREESLKDFLQRFNEVALRIASLDERMEVIAFQKGLRSGAFNIALERANCQTMSEDDTRRDRRRERTPPRDTPEKVLETHQQPIHRDFNTIAGGFAGGGATSAARKRYSQSVLTVSEFRRPPQPEISFSDSDYEGVAPHEDDPVVISTIVMGYNVKRVLIDQGSFADILFWESFEGMKIPNDRLIPYAGTLVGFVGDQVIARGYVNLEMTFGQGAQMKTVVARYLVVNAQSSYSILIGRPTLNKLGAIVSTSHLKVKYPLLSGAVGTLKVDQEVARKCYGDSLKAQRKLYTAQVEQEVHSIGLDPRVSHFDRQLAPTEDIKEVTLAEGKKVKVGTSLSQEDAKKLVEVLKANMSAFAWHVKDMPRVDPDFMCHKLAIDPRAKPVIQKRRKFGENKRKAIAEETDKLLTTGFIREIQYPIWLANVVMVRKSSGKWRMCTDFTDLNKACPKDLYPLPNIDCLIDGALGYELLSFMDAYSGYNQIRVHPADEDKTAFIADQANYCYKVMPFGLKNAGATYQRLMDKVLVDQLGKYQLKLNPEKCSFGVQAGKFLGFLLTHHGIEANPEKCSAIINMRSPSTVKEVEQLTGRMASLSRFLSKSTDKALPLFQCLRKNDRFAWTKECEEAFTELKRSLASPPILKKPRLNLPLLIYISASDRAVSAVLVQEQEGTQVPVYFVSRVLQGIEARYQKIEKLALAILVTARKLRHYFQSYEVIVRTDHPIIQVLQKPDLAGRMMKWSIELSKHSIKYEPRGVIKAQAIADFVMELTAPADEGEVGETQWILSMDGASNLGGSGAGIVLEGPRGILLEQSLRFKFRASNNQAEYEALLAGMALAKEMRAASLSARNDSQLITGQVAGTFQAKDPQLAKYLEKVKLLSENF